MSELPIKIKKSIKEKLPFSVMMGAFRWMPVDFVDKESGEITVADVWKVCGTVWLNPMLRKADEITIELSTILSRIFPCPLEEAKRLIGEITKNNLRHAFVCLESDLVPTSPERYAGKNKWVVMAQYPDFDVLAKKLNKNLQEKGSSLRIAYVKKTR